MQPADLVWGYDAVIAQAREGLRAAAQHGAPLLDKLAAREIANLERRIAEDNRRFARENLRGSERERRRRRTERNVERLEDWVGGLSRAQVERVKQYSERAPLLDEFRQALLCFLGAQDAEQLGLQALMVAVAQIIEQRRAF